LTVLLGICMLLLSLTSSSTSSALCYSLTAAIAAIRQMLIS
jgi:hypothetical protein